MQKYVRSNNCQQDMLADYFEDVETISLIQSEQDLDDLYSYEDVPFGYYESGAFEYEDFYKGDDGFYYRCEDDYGPFSSSLASYRAGFLDNNWGSARISPMGWYRGLRYVKSFTEAEVIQAQYEKAISRTSSYRGNLIGHILSRNGIVYEPLPGSYLCGQELFGNFIVSHFAPKNLVQGMKMIKKVANDEEFPIIISTLPYQANQLIKAGFRAVAKVPQYFAGEIHIKTVCINKAVDMSIAEKLIGYLAEDLLERKPAVGNSN